MYNIILVIGLIVIIGLFIISIIREHCFDIDTFIITIFICFLYFFCITLITLLPFNYETRTETYVIAEQTNQQFYNVGANDKSVSVLIQNDNTLKQQTFNEDITEIVIDEINSKVEITAKYRKEKCEFMLLLDSTKPIEYKKVVIHVPKEK